MDWHIGLLIGLLPGFIAVFGWIVTIERRVTTALSDARHNEANTERLRDEIRWLQHALDRDHEAT